MAQFTPPELDEMHHLIASMRRCATAMKSRYGDIPAMQRIVNDVDRVLVDLDRLDIDAAELDVMRGATPEHRGDKIQIPDTQYDQDFWRDVGDEGVGGQFGRQ